MKIYIIGPVRNATPNQREYLMAYVRTLEVLGFTAYLPQRDAPQGSSTGYELVESELQAISEADEVHVFWDVNSSGSHFDLGMAYALRKPIKIIDLFQPDGEGKSYAKVIEERSKHL